MPVPRVNPRITERPSSHPANRRDLRLLTGLLILLIVLLVAPVTAGLADSAWPKFGHDSQNTGRSEYVGSQTNATKWIVTAGDSFRYSNPVIGSDGTIYVGNYDMNVYAIDPNGTTIWTRTLWGSSSDQIYGSGAVGSDGTIYIGSGGRRIFAINLDGTPKWNSEVLSLGLSGSPAISTDGIIYIGSKHLNAINPVTGAITWQNSTGNANYACPAIGSDGTIYIGSTSSSTSYAFYAFHSDGTQKWVNTTGGSIYGSPAIGADGTIYFGNGDKNIYAYNPDGILKWKNATGGAIRGSPAIGADGTIYIGSADYSVYAWNPDGTLKWQYPTGGSLQYSSPSIGADGTIYIGSDDKNIYALNPDGTQKWFYTTEDTVRGSPTIGSDGSVYVPCYDKKLYAFAGVVDFTADQTISTTTPFTVQFNGTSPLAVTMWHWDFGDGTTSDEQNPEHSYANPGFYAVNLTITHSNGNNYLNRSDYIKVYGAPVARFTSNVTAGESPLTVQFTDTSTGTPASWHWDFGDGTTSDEQNPSHQYSTTGSDTVTYTVSLTATNVADSNTISKSGYITLYSTAPVVSFTGSPRVSAIAPLTVQFHDTSTLSPTEWLWDFGDGSSENATMQNPVHTYATAGTYTVSLNATNAVGPANVSKPGFITFVTPGPIDPSYPYLYVANDEGVKYDINGTNPTYVPNTYSFATMGGLNALHISSGATTSDVTTTTSQSGTFYFTHTGGQPTVPEGILMLAVNGTIPDDFSVHIRSSGDNWTPFGPAYYNGDLPTVWNYVEGAVDQTFTKEDFIYGPQSWKPDGYPIYYGEDEADPINQFRIMFIDLYAGKAYDSVKIEYEFHNLTSFAAFNAYGWYLASNHGTMVMTNDVLGSSTYGASGYSVIGIPDVPKADFTSDASSGWHNLAPIRFTDTSTNVPQIWHWDFGDGTSSSEQNVVHTYTMEGTYTVKLTVTNVKGSSSKTQDITITVPPVPVAEFTSDVTSGTSPLAVQFNDTSSNLPVAWSWDFGDGTNSTERNVTHWYAPGTYTVRLTAKNGGGSDSVLKSDLISVASNGRINQFENSGFEIGDLTGWIPGGTYVSVSSGTTHTGSYSVSFPGVTRYDKYVKQYVDLTDATTISFWGYGETSDATQFFRVYIDDVNVYSAGILQNNWNLYTIAISGYTGVHPVQVTFDNSYRALSSYVDDFCAGSAATCGGSGTPTTPPTAAFTATPVNGAAPLAVAFTDATTNSPTSWSWNFGDGGTSTYRNPTHTYGSAGTYTVKLTATNAGGSNTMTRTGLVYVVNATGPVTDYNKTYIRTANHDGIRWDANGNGTYYVQGGTGGLSAIRVSTDPTDTTGKVTLTNSQSGTIYATSSGSYLDEVILLLAVNGTVPDNFAARIKTSGYTWTPVEDAAPAAGSYTYQSTALDQTFTKADLFYGPQDWKPTQGNPAYPLFAGEEMNSPASQYQLMFIDTRAGLLPGSASLKNNGAVRVDYAFTNLPDNAVFNVYGWRTATGMGWTNDVTTSGYTVNTIVLPPVANFEANQTSGIAPFNPRFRDTSLNIPTGWSWEFGEGNTSTKQTPDYTYVTTGTYTVKLTATNSKGSDTKTRTNYITVTAPKETTNAFTLSGVTANTTGTTQTIAVNATNTTVGSNNVITVTNVSSTWDHLDVTLAAAPADDGLGNWTGTVQGVEAVAANVSVPIESLGNPNVTLSLSLSKIPDSSAAITSTITSDPESSVWSSFTLAATSGSKQIVATAYTVAFTKTNIENAGSGTSGIIRSANITMAVNHTWVENNGGTSRIAVMHRSDAGEVTFLTTEWTGLCVADGNDYFVAVSPDGLSTFVLTAVAPVTTTTSSSNSFSGSTAAADAAAAENAAYLAAQLVTPSASPTVTGTATPTPTPVPAVTTRQKVRITPWPTGEVLSAPQENAPGGAVSNATPSVPEIRVLWKNPLFLAAEAIAAIAILTVALAGYIRKRRRDRDPLRP